MEPTWKELLIVLPAIAAAIAIGLWGTRTVGPWTIKMLSSLLGVKQVSDMLSKHIIDEDEQQQEIMKSVAAMHAKQEDLSKDLKEIVKEFKPNSGETVRDALNRIESNVDLTGERQRARMLDSKEMLLETDRKGNVIWTNRTIVRRLGRLPGELYGNGWINIIHSNRRDHFKTEWQEAIDEGREFETHIKLVSADGKPLEVMLKAYLMHDINHIPLGWLISFQTSKYQNSKDHESIHS